jgi:hypothetical protein
MNTGVIQGRAIGQSGVVLMARVVDQNAANIAVSSITSIAYRVRDIDGASSGNTTTLTVADVVYDTLQTGNGWDTDTTGYNFRAVIPASQFAWMPEVDGGGVPKPRRYQIDVKFTPQIGEPFVVVFGLWVHPVWIE